jgi:hypothetical protein
MDEGRNALPLARALKNGRGQFSESLAVKTSPAGMDDPA